MFDLFGVSSESLDKSNKEHIINVIALLLLLVEKGIITDDEFCKMRIRAISVVDQIWQKQVEEKRKQLKEENPSLDSFFGKIFGQI